MGTQQRNKQGGVDKTGKADKAGNPESFFNPFASLGKNLKADEKRNAPATGTKQTAPGQKGQAGQKSPKPPATPHTPVSPDETDEADAALFLNAVGSHFDSDAALFMNSLSSNSDPKRTTSKQADTKKTDTATTPKQAAPEVGYSDRDTAAFVKKATAFDADESAFSEDAAAFTAAMQGVSPVEGRGRETPRKPALADAQRKLAADLNRSYLEEFLQGKIEFALEYTEEFFEGHVMGLDPLIQSKLRAGQYSPESHVDLHGQNAEQAYAALVEFIRHAYNKGQRSVVVVTGRGKNSPGGFGVLRQNMQNWLTRDPLKRVVLAFCTARPKDGGAGAIYVLLRKLKKSSGKIRWDMLPGDRAGFDL